MTKNDQIPNPNWPLVIGHWDLIGHWGLVIRKKANMTWKDDLNYGFAAFGVQIPERVSLSDWAEKLAENPTENTAYVVAASSILFYLVERGHNPKVNDVW